jgi:hypothetical protein
MNAKWIFKLRDAIAVELIHRFTPRFSAEVQCSPVGHFLATECILAKARNPAALRTVKYGMTRLYLVGIARIGVEILECLYGIELQKAYAELKYDELFTYCGRLVMRFGSE